VPGQMQHEEWNHGCGWTGGRVGEGEARGQTGREKASSGFRAPRQNMEPGSALRPFTEGHLYISDQKRLHEYKILPE
jgi:hypothetical protein